MMSKLVSKAKLTTSATVTLSPGLNTLTHGLRDYMGAPVGPDLVWVENVDPIGAMQDIQTRRSDEYICNYYNELQTPITLTIYWQVYPSTVRDSAIVWLIARAEAEDASEINS